jgi:hypothetical protein
MKQGLRTFAWPKLPSRTWLSSLSPAIQAMRLTDPNLRAGRDDAPVLLLQEDRPRRLRALQTTHVSAYTCNIQSSSNNLP